MDQGQDAASWIVNEQTLAVGQFDQKAMTEAGNQGVKTLIDFLRRTGSVGLVGSQDKGFGAMDLPYEKSAFQAQSLTGSVDIRDNQAWVILVLKRK
jgi:hypothetical protein